MPTMFECLSSYCKQYQLAMPRKNQRCLMGRSVHLKWLGTDNIENIDYNWSEEPEGRFRVICYPPAFAPTIVETIDEFFIAQKERKTNKTQTAGFSPRKGPWGDPPRKGLKPSQERPNRVQRPSKESRSTLNGDYNGLPNRVQRPLNEAVDSVNGPYEDPIERDSTPSQDGQLTLAEGSKQPLDRGQYPYPEGPLRDAREGEEPAYSLSDPSPESHSLKDDPAKDGDLGNGPTNRRQRKRIYFPR